MADRFHSLSPEDIRLLSFEDNTIKVVLKSGQEATFEFETRDALSQALLSWASKPAELQPKVAFGDSNR